jgi:flavin-dependent dehydrogenase
MPIPETVDYDVAIIGAGPAGALAAAELARQEFRVIVLERGPCPNFHLPETIVRHRFPVLEKFRLTNRVAPALRQGVVAVLREPSGRQSIRIEQRFDPIALSIDDSDETLCCLDRRLLDRILVEHAAEAGAEIRLLTPVKHIEFERPGIVNLVTVAGGTEHRITVRHVLDASGKAALVANQIGLKTDRVRLDRRQCVFVHYHAPKLFGDLEQHAVYLSPLPTGYAFIIPLAENRVSVGVIVADAAALETAEESFRAGIGALGWLSGALADAIAATPVISAQGEAFTCAPIAADDFTLVGEAAGFADPFFSIGTAVALDTAPLAADAVAARLNGAPASAGLAGLYADAVKENRDRFDRVMANAGFAPGPRDLADPHVSYGITQFLLATMAGGSDRFGELGLYGAMAACRKHFA